MLIEPLRLHRQALGLRRAWPRCFAGRNRGCFLRAPFLLQGAWLEQTLHPAFLLCLAARDPRYTGRHIDRQGVTLHHILPLGNNDIPKHSHGIGSHVEDAGIAGGRLVFLRDNHVARGLDPLDLLVLLVLRRSGLGCAGGRRRRLGGRVVLIEHNQRLAAHARIALDQMNVAGKRCHLVLVAHLEGGRVDLDRLIAVLREPLQRIRRTIWLLLRIDRGNVHGRRDRQCYECSSRTGRHGEPRRTEVCAGAAADAESCGAGRTWSGVSVSSTPPPNRIKAPLSTTSSRLAFNKPLGSFSSTGLSETILPLVTLTVASDRCPS